MLLPGGSILSPNRRRASSAPCRKMWISTGSFRPVRKTKSWAHSWADMNLSAKKCILRKKIRTSIQHFALSIPPIRSTITASSFRPGTGANTSAIPASTNTTIPYSTGAASVSFAGETQLTSAIDYVCRSSVPVLYQLSGHGEAELSSEFTSAIARDNIEIQTLDLISENRIPEDASCILINSPVKDISSEECSLLKAGLSDGKSIILIT